MNTAQNSIVEISNFIYDRHPDIIKILINKHKIRLSNILKKMHKNCIAYGPFKGLKLSSTTHWSAPDHGAMILGLYEQEILQQICSLPQKYNTLIDLGAADGYYGIGVLVNHLFSKSYCYEITEKGRTSILENAKLNNLESQVEIRGIATQDFIDEFAQSICDTSVLLIDIEGGEFDLLTKNVFEKFKNSPIFVEIHDFFFADGKNHLNKILSNSKSTHKSSVLTTSNRDLSIFSELKSWNDHDRWLLCSEGRAQQMIWIRFDPMQSID